MRLHALMIPFLLAGGCGPINAVPGTTENRSFAAKDFNRVALKGADNVNIIIGPAFSVRAIGPQNILDNLDITVENGTLKIARKSKNGLSVQWNSTSAVVTVTMPAIIGADVAGSGDLDIDAIAADNLELNIAGSGNIGAAGTAKNLKIGLAGSGDVNVQKLSAQTADISVAGSGNVSAHATKSAAISIIGSGDVMVSGTAQCAISKIGSGDARCTL